jgi:hypothetical protein
MAALDLEGRGLMLITDDWRRKNAELHATRPDFGTSGNQWLGYVLETIDEEGFTDILDYGCGKSTLGDGLRSMRGLVINEYDPAIDGKAVLPDPADLVICTDVLEHIQPNCLDAVLAHLALVTKKKLIFDVSLVDASKTMPDGSPAHLLVKPASWWKEQIEQHFDVTLWRARPEFKHCHGEAVPKGMGLAEQARKASMGKRRRKITPDLVEFFAHIRKAQSTTAAFARIDTIRLYEGVRDQMSDMHVIFDWLDETEDPKQAIKDALRLTRKVLVVRAAITAERTAEWWKAICDEYMRVTDWQAENGTIVAMGSPKVGIHGVTVVGVLESEERWEQVQAACARIDKRVTLSEPHGRRAILACYGPSLRQHVTRLADEMEECNGEADVFSVSGAHDFLIDNGVIPTYHIECDPRPHKADNILAPVHGIQYLIGSTAHPKLFAKLAGADIALWHVGTAEHSQRLVKELKEEAQLVIPGGGSVGLRSLPLLYGMGYRDFSIYGMDCSFAEEGQQQWAGKHAGKRQDVVHIYVLGQGFDTSPQLISYATDFLEVAQTVSDCEFRVYGEGLLPAMCRLHARLAAA